MAMSTAAISSGHGGLAGKKTLQDAWLILVTNRRRFGEFSVFAQSLQQGWPPIDRLTSGCNDARSGGALKALGERDFLACPNRPADGISEECQACARGTKRL